MLPDTLVRMLSLKTSMLPDTLVRMLSLKTSMLPATHKAAYQPLTKQFTCHSQSGLLELPLLIQRSRRHSCLCSRF